MDQQDKRKLLSSLVIAGLVVGLMWVLHMSFLFFSIDKSLFGNIPRHTVGLIGIFTSPFVHADIWHLFANSGPLFMFMAGTLYFYRRVSLRAILGIMLLTGIWVWLFAHSGSHIGASGMVYGLGAFLFFSGIFRRDVRSITLSLLIALFYGGMVWGVVPGQDGISWESHLFGAMAGIGFAWLYRKVDVVPRKRYAWESEPENDPNDAHAEWNYQENWHGSKTLYTPGDSDSQE